MEFSQQDISFHSHEIKKELESLKEILRKTSENPSVSHNLSRIKNSQITNTSNFLTKFIKSSHQNPEIFSILAQKSIDHNIFIKIPETLLYSSHGKSPVFIYNSLENFITTDSSEHSINKFFSYIQTVYPAEPDCFPLFIHKSKGRGIQLFFDAESARKEFEECPYRYHILQRYVKVSSQSAWKVSVFWSEGKLKYFTLINNQSVLKESKNNMSKFLVNSKDLKSYHVVASLQPILPLNNLTKNLVPALNKFLNKSQSVSKIVIDFIKDTDNDWVFIGIPGCTFKGEVDKFAKHKKKLSPLNPNLTSYPSISFTREKSISSPEELQEKALSKVENRRITKLSNKIFRKATSVGIQKDIPRVVLPDSKEQYSYYLQLKSSDSLGRIPFNMIGIMPQNIGSHLTYFVENKKELIPTVKSSNFKKKFLFGDFVIKESSEYLDRIAGELDKKTLKGDEKNFGKEVISEFSERSAESRV